MWALVLGQNKNFFFVYFSSKKLTKRRCLTTFKSGEQTDREDPLKIPIFGHGHIRFCLRSLDHEFGHKF